MSATTTQLLSSGEFCKLRYDTIPVKSASANVSFYTNQWRTQGGFACSTPPPRNSDGPPKNRAKLNPIVKTVKKIADFRTPTHQDVWKKGSKILKLRRFSIVLH